MQNKFGLKDFVLLVLILVVGILVLLSMYQEDRRFVLVQDLKSTLRGQEAALQRVEDSLVSISQTLETGAIEPRDPGFRLVQTAYRPHQDGTPSQPADEPKSDAKQPEGEGGRRPRIRERDESWGREGVPIEWQEPWSFATDPRKLPGYQSGGEFVEIFEGQPAKFTPHLNVDVYGARVIDEVCQYLAAYDPKTLTLRGQLADAWQYDPDGLWLRVHINPRARFSDGSKVAAEDVRWTFKDFIMNPELETDRVRAIMDVISDCQVISEEVVEFTFGEAKWTNLTQALGFEVLPKAFYSKLTTTQINQGTGLLMGSGPYRLERLDVGNQWKPGDDIVLVRNERYWGPRSPLERLRYKSINDELARLTAYRNGEGDMFLPSSPQFNLVQRQDPKWNETNYSLNWINMRSGYGFIGWQCGERNGKLTPFHDKRVRQAMTLIIDRQAVVRDIYDGIGMVAKGPFNPSTPASNPDLKPWPFDEARAKALLGEAGWKARDGSGILKNDAGDEFVFEFTRPAGGEVTKRMADYVKGQCERNGIRCNVRVMDWAAYDQMLKTRDFDAVIMGWSANSPESDIRQMFHSKSIEGQGDNFIQWSSPECDALLDRGLRELDTAKRQKIWQDVEAVLHDEQPYTFVRVVPWLRFVDRAFSNVNAYPKGLEPWEFYMGSAGARPTSPQ